MATTVEGAIKEALFARLAALVLTPVHPIAWPNVIFPERNADGTEKPKPSRYLEAKYVPNTVDRVLIDTDGPHQRLGFLQVNVRDGLNQGTRIDDIAGAVAKHFPADLRLHHAFGLSVRITAAPEPAPALIETTPSGVLVAVLVPWETWA